MGTRRTTYRQGRRRGPTAEPQDCRHHLRSLCLSGEGFELRGIQGRGADGALPVDTHRWRQFLHGAEERHVCLVYTFGALGDWGRMRPERVEFHAVERSPLRLEEGPGCANLDVRDRLEARAQ